MSFLSFFQLLYLDAGWEKFNVYKKIGHAYIFGFRTVKDEDFHSCLVFCNDFGRGWQGDIFLLSFWQNDERSSLQKFDIRPIHRLCFNVIYLIVSCRVRLAPLPPPEK